MRRAAVIGIVLAMVAVFWPWPVGAQQGPLRLLGQFSFESKRTFQDTTVGGLSGLAYNAKRGVYYAVSDDRGENQAPRYYTLEIDADASGVHDARVIGVTFFDADAETPGIQPFERGDSDMEDILLLDDDTLLVSSERDRENRPWVKRFALDGTSLGDLPLPPHYMSTSEAGPDGRPRVTRGIRGNLGFEGMALTPSQETLYLASEQALAQDGPMSSPEAGTSSRILRLELYESESRPTAEYVYGVERIFAASSDPAVPADNGVSAMLWIRHIVPEYDLLTVERAFALGSGNDVNIYGVTLENATDVRDAEALPSPYTGRTASKTLLGNLTALGVQPDNLEAIVIGPRLPDGKATLILMSDDNFNDSQINQFVLLEIE